jgi:hypothetical protein
MKDKKLLQFALEVTSGKLMPLIRESNPQSRLANPTID